MSDGAIDKDFDENERSYEDQVADALEDILTEPMSCGVALDLVTRQLVYVHEKVADTLEEYYENEDFDLATYKTHPFLPVRLDDAVYDVVFMNADADRIHKPGKCYAFPRGRLATVPVDMAWRDVEVDSL